MTSLSRRDSYSLLGAALALACAALQLVTPAVAQRPNTPQAPSDEASFSIADVARLQPDSLATQVLVLGTPHLARLGGRFQPSMVDGLLAVLATYRPDAIAVESLPPHAIRAMQAQPAYDSVLTRFAGPAVRLGTSMQSALGVSPDEASARADAGLASAESGTLPNDDRVDLVQHLLAAYRIDTAALQWRYLSDEARASAHLPGRTRAYLDRRLRRSHEIDAVAARLAVRLGHQRLTPIDDHRNKDRLFVLAPLLQDELPTDSLLALQEFIGDVWDTRNRAVRRGDLLPFYRAINRPAFLREDVRRQWLLFLRTQLDSGRDRSRLALWEARNLHIAANIRRLTAQHPGGRVLVLIGASHKPFLDAALDDMLGVRRVNLQDVVQATRTP